MDVFFFLNCYQGIIYMGFLSLNSSNIFILILAAFMIFISEDIL